MGIVDDTLLRVDSGMTLAEIGDIRSRSLVAELVTGPVIANQAQGPERWCSRGQHQARIAWPLDVCGGCMADYLDNGGALPPGMVVMGG